MWEQQCLEEGKQKLPSGQKQGLDFCEPRLTHVAHGWELRILERQRFGSVWGSQHSNKTEDDVLVTSSVPAPLVEYESSQRDRHCWSCESPALVRGRAEQGRADSLPGGQPWRRGQKAVLTACPHSPPNVLHSLRFMAKSGGNASSQQQSPQHHRHSREGTDTAPEDLDSPFIYLFLFNYFKISLNFTRLK